MQHTIHKNMWNPMWTKKHVAIEAIELHTSEIKLLTCLIPTPLHPATMGIEVCMNCEERGCEVVERIYAYLHNLCEF